MKWILVVLGILVAVLALVALVGALLPKEHVASRAARFRQPPESIWQAITDYEKFPSWRPGVKIVQRLPDRNGRLVWVEKAEYGPRAQQVPIEVVESRPPAGGSPGRLVTRIADPHLPFGGTWTYELVAASGTTTLRITENGEVYNPIFRFLSRFVFGHTATLEAYLKALGKKLGEEIRVEQ